MNGQQYPSDPGSSFNRGFGSGMGGCLGIAAAMFVMLVVVVLFLALLAHG